MKLSKLKTGIALCLCSGAIIGTIGGAYAAEYNPSVKWSGNECTVTTKACSDDILGYYLVAEVSAYNKQNKFLGSSGKAIEQYSTKKNTAKATVNKSKTYYTYASFYVTTDKEGTNKRPGGIENIYYAKP